MPRIDRETVQRILDTAQIVDVVGDYVSLKRRGSGYIGLCPFHNDRSPSFSVSPSRNVCKCFACGEGGSPVNFLMKVENISYHDALKALAKKYNIEIKERELSAEERERETERESLMAVNEWALDYFEKTLHDTDEGRSVGKSYFTERGLTEATIRKFHLGYAPDMRDTMYRAAISAGYDEKYIIATGLASRSDKGYIYDRFRGRVIYPVHTISGRVIAFGGRTLRSDKTMAKYVNSPESSIYSKSHQLYGLYQARQAITKHDRVYLVEGYMDVISMSQSGVENVVASSGTALTEGQIQLIKRLTGNVTLIYDSDEAGLKATMRAIDMLLAEGLDITIVQFPEGEDPDSFSQNHSAIELEEFIKSRSRDFVTFKADVLLSRAPQGDPIARAEAITSICSSIASVGHDVKRAVYVEQAARILSMPQDVIALQVAKMAAAQAETNRTVAQRNAGQRDIEEFARRQAASRTTDATAVETKVQSRAQSDGKLALLEREVIRYVVKYGQCVLETLSTEDSQQRLTVLGFVRQEMELDGLELSDPASVATLQAAVRIVESEWEKAYAGFVHRNDDDIKAWRSRAYEELRGRADQANLSTEEKRIDEESRLRLAQADDAFRAGFIGSRLINDENDTVRALATELYTDRFVLSNMHTRYGHVPTERDRLPELIERAVYEWKDGIITGMIRCIESRIAEECAKPGGGDPTAIRSLMEEQLRITEIKKEFAKTLGERIICP